MDVSGGWLSSAGLVTAGLVTVGLVAAHLLLQVCFPLFWRDLSFLLKLVRYGARLEMDKARGDVRTVLERFIQHAQRVPHKPLLLFEGQALTYGDVERRSNRLAHVLRRESGARRGACAALLMSNGPDFICSWFALSKLGFSTAFLNTNMKNRSLLHCFRSCGASLLLVGGDMCELLDEVLEPLLEEQVEVWLMKRRGEHPELHPKVRTLLDKEESASDEPLPPALRHVSDIRTPTLYIFTSGTTGLPKAAVISHLQSLKAAGGFWALGGTEDDVIYIPLPLYHSAASLVGIGGTVHLGATCVLKKKFSASQFWSDCREHHVTIFQYIGELCRYLLHQPKSELDQVHAVQMGVGNGLRPDVWREFHRRFGKIRMCEVYGSTEGNLCFINHIGRIGTVGRSNFFYKLLFKYDLVKYDLQRDEPLRDKHGFCQRVQRGETGLLLSKVSALSPFFGYAGSRSLTEKKIMRDVFVNGDVYVNTGDLMSEDQDGFICFRDRVGDTFRWKGENVATTEVAEVLGLVDFIQEANVYGVEVQGHEGRAGMAALILRPGQTFDGDQLFQRLQTDLPRYARPLFIRLQEQMEMTSTFKQQKFRLVQSGFDPSSVSDPLFIVDHELQTYVPLSPALHRQVLSGAHKL